MKTISKTYVDALVQETCNRMWNTEDADDEMLADIVWDIVLSIAPKELMSLCVADETFFTHSPGFGVGNQSPSDQVAGNLFEVVHQRARDVWFDDDEEDDVPF